MSSSSKLLRTMILNKLGEVLPGEDLSELPKHELLALLARSAGLRATFEAGRAMRAIPDSPMSAALCRATTPADLMRRWSRLERYGHTTHRTVLLDHAEDSLSMEHASLDGAVISAAQDLFIWGVLSGLCERANLPVLEIRAAEQIIWSAQGYWGEPEETRVVDFLFCVNHRKEMESVSPAARDEGVIEQVNGLIREDLLRTWKLGDVARALHTSPRQLQRTLSAQQSTFSEQVQRARLESACTMIERDELSLTEIAFCSGFADSAHFTRTFRKHMDVPPMAYRDAVRMEAREEH